MSILSRIRWGLINIVARKSPPCCQIAHRISDGRQQPLTRRERLTIQIHLMICDWCTNFSRQIVMMADASRREAQAAELGEDTPIPLSESARERIRRTLDQS